MWEEEGVGEAEMEGRVGRVRMEGVSQELEG